MSTIFVNNISPYSGNSINLSGNSINLSGNSINLNGNVTITGSMSGSNISDTVYSVYYGLNASGTSISTNSVCNYGINVFTGITATNYATKLPQPITGRAVKIVNLSNSILWVYPSNTGGTINNLTINTGVQIPPDGKPYEFYCIENPLPGAWTFTSPATAQYDSGEIVISYLTGATGTSNDQGISAADSNNFSVILPYISASWYYNGYNGADVLTNSAVAFKPATPWFGITKIKVYTNLSECAISGTTGISSFGLTGSFGTNYYATGATGGYSAGDFITNGVSNNGNVTPHGTCNKIISGAILLTGTSVQAEIGDPGTLWGEITTGLSTSVSVTTVGDVYLGPVLFPYGSPAEFVGEMVDARTTGYISFQLKPLVNQSWTSISDLKVRFIIEYF
jgi:hypothetical protein